MDAKWKNAAESFFGERARRVSERPSLEEVCRAAGRDPRLWRDESLYAEMIDDIVDKLGVGPETRLLEIGCGTGFLAWGLAPRCREYLGVDVVRPALSVARRLGLEHATFRREDGAALSMATGSFDCVLAYDVFTNFRDFADVEAVIREMWRVTKPGGRLLIGSVPDSAHTAEAAECSARLTDQLTKRYGALVPDKDPGVGRGFFARMAARIARPVVPAIGCYALSSQQFERLGKQLGGWTEILAIHASNPYRGSRFNVLIHKPA